jgi:hypothetical protein
MSLSQCRCTSQRDKLAEPVIAQVQTQPDPHPKHNRKQEPRILKSHLRRNPVRDSCSMPTNQKIALQCIAVLNILAAILGHEIGAPLMGESPLC